MASHVDHNQCQTDGIRMHCHRIITKDVTTQDTGSIFIERTHVKEKLNPNEVVKMFEQDFSERRRDKPMSLEDRKFLDITKGEIHVTKDGHYEIPLPFRDDKVNLPCNRKLAESRLSGLKSKFAKDARKERLCREGAREGWEDLVSTTPRSVSSTQAQQDQGRV